MQHMTVEQPEANSPKQFLNQVLLHTEMTIQNLALVSLRMSSHTC